MALTTSYSRPESTSLLSIVGYTNHYYIIERLLIMPEATDRELAIQEFTALMSTLYEDIDDMHNSLDNMRDNLKDLSRALQAVSECQ